VAKNAKSKRKEYTKDDVKLLKAHSKARTPVSKLSKMMKRSEGSLRQKALSLGIGLGSALSEKAPACSIAGAF